MLYGDGLPYGNGRRLWTLMTGRCVTAAARQLLEHRRRLEYGCSSLHGGEADATCFMRQKPYPVRGACRHAPGALPSGAGHSPERHWVHRGGSRAPARRLPAGPALP